MSKYLPALLLVAAAAMLWLISTLPEEAGVSVAATAVQAEVSPQVAPVLAGAGRHGVQLLSLHGELQLTAGLRDLFDYYLQDLGARTLADISASVQQALARQLEGPALQQAETIYAHYLDYRQALQPLDSHYQLPADGSQEQRLALLAERQQAVVALQDQILGAHVAAVFFAFDRERDRYTLEKAHLLAQDMSDDARQQALLNLQAGLPQATRLQQQQDAQQQQLLAIDAADMSAAQRYRQRAQLVGDEGAQRLSALDEQRAQWQQRLQRFRADVRRLQQAGLAGEDAEQAYERLLAEQFERPEWLRVRALTGHLAGLQ